MATAPVPYSTVNRNTLAAQRSSDTTSGLSPPSSAAFLIIVADTPVLGICLGMQFLLEESEEEGVFTGLGLVKGRVVPFTEGKIPHMGWNAVDDMRGPLFDGIPSGTQFYFVHSYFADTTDEFTLGTTEYYRTFASAVGKDNVFGVQFHPEKSGAAGLQLMRNFMRI